ncbi:MAG: BF3164 family lipoprotein [Rikenellaceae bacterium]
MDLKCENINNFDAELGALALFDAGDYILCQLMNDQYFYAVYSKHNLEKVINILPKGKGHNEYLAATYTGQFIIENNETKIFILEMALNRYFKVNLSKTIQTDVLSIEKEYDIYSYNKASYRSMFLLDDSTLFGVEDERSGCQNVILYPGRNKCNNIKSLLDLSSNNPNIHGVVQTMTTKHPTDNLFASTYFSFPRIDFINGKGEMYKTIFYKEYISLDQALDSDHDYFDIVASDVNYIYALYNSVDYTQEDDSLPAKSSVLVFSWQGEPICEYEIDYASNIFIDPLYKKIYAFDNTQGTYIVKRYSI